MYSHSQSSVVEVAMQDAGPTSGNHLFFVSFKATCCAEEMCAGVVSAVANMKFLKVSSYGFYLFSSL